MQIKHTLFSMTDMDEACQHLLGKFPARHRHGNLLDMYDPKAVQSVFNKQRLQMQRWNDFVVAKRSNCEKKTFKQALVLELKLHILEVVEWAKWPTQCQCLNHGVFAEKLCNLVPPQHARSLWLDLTSVSCVPWSSQGLQLGWLQHENLATIFWGMSLSVHTPDLIALECTPRFDVEFIEVLSQGKVNFSKAVIGPVVSGIPVTGDRLWALAATQKMKFNENPLDQSQIENVLLTSLVATPDMFLRASPGQLLKFKESVNKSQAKIPPHPRGKQYSWEHIISTGNQTRLEFHRFSCHRARLSDPALNSAKFFWDVVQNVHHHRRPSLPSLCPRPLTGSFIWSESAERPMMPHELLSLQGSIHL